MAIKDWKKIKGLKSHQFGMLNSKTGKSIVSGKYVDKNNKIIHLVTITQYVKGKGHELIKEKEFKNSKDVTKFAKAYMRKH